MIYFPWLTPTTRGRGAGLSVSPSCIVLALAPAENSRSDVQWCRPQRPSANRHTWFSSLTLQKALTYPQSLACTSETPPAGLRHEEGPASTCHINQYRTKQKPTEENFKQHHRGQTVALHWLHYWINALKEGFIDSQSKYSTPWKFRVTTAPCT